MTDSYNDVILEIISKRGGMFFWDSLAIEKKDYYQFQFVRLFKALLWTMPHMFLAISTREISTAIIIHILRTNFEFLILEDMFGIA